MHKRLIKEMPAVKCKTFSSPSVRAKTLALRSTEVSRRKKEFYSKHYNKGKMPGKVSTLLMAEMKTELEFDWLFIQSRNQIFA